MKENLSDFQNFTDAGFFPVADLFSFKALASSATPIWSALESVTAHSYPAPLHDENSA